MAAGIALGPSLLGAVAPGVFNQLFAPESLGFLGVLSQIGVIVFLFGTGWTSPGAMSGIARQPRSSSAASASCCHSAWVVAAALRALRRQRDAGNSVPRVCSVPWELR
jgi:Kef-type K+ transport system membrane component KefB